MLWAAVKLPSFFERRSFSANTSNLTAAEAGPPPRAGPA